MFSKLFFEMKVFCMTDQTKMKNFLTPAQLGYIAGFLDGDGSIITQIVQRPGNDLKYQIRFTISFFQKTKRKHFLIQLHDELKKGTLRDRNDGMSEINIVGWQSVLPLLEQLRPYLRIKLKQANLVMKIIEQLPLAKKSPDKFLELCSLTDQVSDLNDSKKRQYDRSSVEKTFLDLGIIGEIKAPVETFSVEECLTNGQEDCIPTDEQ